MYFKFLTMATFLTVPVSTAGVVSLPVSGKFQSFPDPADQAHPDLAVLNPDLQQSRQPLPFLATLQLVGSKSNKGSLRDYLEGKFHGEERLLKESAQAVPSPQISPVSVDTSLDKVGIVQPVALVAMPVRIESPRAVAVPVFGQGGPEAKLDQRLQAVAVDVQTSPGRRRLSGIPAIGSVTGLRSGGHADATSLSQLPDASALRYRTTARNAYKVYFPYNDDGIANLKGTAARAGAVTDSHKTISDLGGRLLEDGYYSYPSEDDHDPAEGSGSVNAAKEQQGASIKTVEPPVRGNPASIPATPIQDLEAQSGQGENANVL